MSKLSGDHVRMLRAALRLNLRQFAEMAGLNKMTVSGLERGTTKTYASTSDKIREAFAPYVEFVEPVEGVRGPGIIMKWGVQPIGDDTGEPDAATSKKPGGALSSAPWDDFSGDDERPLSPEVAQIAASLTDEDLAELSETLDAVPISAASRRLIERAMRAGR